MTDSIALLCLLVGLELVLGVDNILVISIFAGKLPETHRNKARITGLAVAMVARIIMLFLLIRLSGLTDNIILHFSIRDLILLSGGLFLLWKAVKEIHHTIELKDEGPPITYNLSKGYIYLPMGFALFIEILQMRYEHNKRKA